MALSGAVRRRRGFDGREGTFSLDGAATTALLGADYARGRWLIGLALAQSAGEGDYRDTKIDAPLALAAGLSRRCGGYGRRTMPQRRARGRRRVWRRR